MALVIEGRYFPNLLLIPFCSEEIDASHLEPDSYVDLVLPDCDTIFKQNKNREVALSGDVYIDCDSSPTSPPFYLSPSTPAAGGVVFLKSNANNLAVYLPDKTVRILQKNEVAAFRVPDAVNFRIVYRHCLCSGQSREGIMLRNTNKFGGRATIRYKLQGDAKLEDVLFLAEKMKSRLVLEIRRGEDCILARPIKFSFSVFTDVPAVDIYKVEAELEEVGRC